MTLRSLCFLSIAFIACYRCALGQGQSCPQACEAKIHALETRVAKLEQSSPSSSLIRGNVRNVEAKFRDGFRQLDLGQIPDFSPTDLVIVVFSSSRDDARPEHTTSTPGAIYGMRAGSTVPIPVIAPGGATACTGKLILSSTGQLTLRGADLGNNNFGCGDVYAVVLLSFKVISLKPNI